MQTKYEKFILNDKVETNKFSQNGNKAAQYWSIQNFKIFLIESILTVPWANCNEFDIKSIHIPTQILSDSTLIIGYHIPRESNYLLNYQINPHDYGHYHD